MKKFITLMLLCFFVNFAQAETSKVTSGSSARKVRASAPEPCPEWGEGCTCPPVSCPISTRLTSQQKAKIEKFNKEYFESLKAGN